MKNQHYTLLIAVIMALCSSELQGKPWNNRVVDSIFRYVLPSEHLYGANEWSIGDACSDIAEGPGGSSGDGDDLEEIMRGNIKSWMNPVRNYYHWNYFGIGLCNQYLAVAKTNAPGAQQKATVLFLRSLMYFNLVRLYGGVPWFSEDNIVNVDSIKSLRPSVWMPVIQSDTLHKPRVNADSIYNHIESDLNAAIVQLPLRSQITESLIDKITKGAAQTLLLKIKIYRQQWEEALTLAETIIQSGEYVLENKFDTIFFTNNKYGKETIFELYQPPIYAWVQDLQDYWIAANHNVFLSIRNMLHQTKANGKFETENYYGWGSNCPTERYVKSFATGDPRLKLSVLAEGDTFKWETNLLGIALPKDTFLNEGYPPSPTGYYPRKYFVTPYDWRLSVIKTPRPIQHSGGIKDIVIFRYADVLLMAAEAALNTGDTATALGYINQVRTRARNNGTAGAPANLTSITYNAILNERCWEFATEGQRYFDLIRTRKADSVLNGLYNYTWKEKRKFDTAKNYLFPIPYLDILRNKGMLTQNPGYEFTLPEITKTKNGRTFTTIIDTTSKKYCGLTNTISFSNYFNLDSCYQYRIVPTISVETVYGNITEFVNTVNENDEYKPNIFPVIYYLQYKYSPQNGDRWPAFPFTDKLIVHVHDYQDTITDTFKLVFMPKKVVSVKEINNSKPSGKYLYPNPTGNIIYIANADGDEWANVFDLTGKQVLSVSHANGQVYLGQMNPGLYLIEVSNSRGVYFQKIFKK